MLKLQLNFITNKKLQHKIAKCEMIVEINIPKNKEFEIYKISTNDYKINSEKTKLIFCFKNFADKESFNLGLIFSTSDNNLLDTVVLKQTFIV